MFSNITFIYKCKVSIYIYRSIMYFLDIKILSLAQINNLIIFHWKKNVLIYIPQCDNTVSVFFMKWWEYLFFGELCHYCVIVELQIIIFYFELIKLWRLAVYKQLLLQLFTFLSKSDYRQAWIINCMIILLKYFWHNLSFHCIFRGILINDL